jgi:hypothetical protein
VAWSRFFGDDYLVWLLVLGGLSVLIAGLFGRLARPKFKAIGKDYVIIEIPRLGRFRISHPEPSAHFISLSSPGRVSAVRLEGEASEMN